MNTIPMLQPSRRTRCSFRTLVTCWLLAGAAALVPVGCASTPTAADRTDTISLEFTVRDTSEGLSAARYVVDRDGTIHWGGGVEADNGRTTWSGPMSDADCATFVRLIRDDGWLTRQGVTTSGTPKTLETVVIVRGDGRRVSHRLRGEGAALDRLRAFLEQASLARLDRFLRTLPEASGRS